MSNCPLTNERAAKMTINATNSNETSNETCLEEIISNVEIDDMDNSDNNSLEQFEEKHNVNDCKYCQFQ
ncbi:38632_t:CDS:2 [Gigaspora margarita]|uniref:38632_t:CDS:1 n=1 Tax=Gigaspora margarita TaxID=4874 RepID=A0ABN7VTU4_GIGMA|nr:38632_t:CDS:2 [Gigaspora margarita]